MEGPVMAEDDFPASEDAMRMPDLIFPQGSHPECESTDWVGFHRQISELRLLSGDWDSHGSLPPNKAAICAAHLVLEKLIEHLVPPESISASSEGGVGFVFSRPDRYAIIECLNSGETVAGYSDRGSMTESWITSCDPSDMKSTLVRIEDFLGGAVRSRS